jgi:hypothetical protein
MTPPGTTAATAGARHVAGPVLFARYAYAPNELGYCGPEDHPSLLGYGSAQVSDPGLVQLARAFTGPWPYLKLLAGAAGIDDPFDRRVVEAYWIGNDLLDRVRLADFGNALEERFRGQAGRWWSHLAEGIPAGAVADHNFHVFGVYPWVGVLTSGRSDDALHQLDRCRIRWGQVVHVAGDQVEVRSPHLTWDGTRLGLSEPRLETVRRAVGGTGFVEDLQAGDWVAMHWHWVCDRLDARQLRNLRRFALRQLTITNDRVAHSGPGMVIAGS